MVYLILIFIILTIGTHFNICYYLMFKNKNLTKYSWGNSRLPYKTNKYSSNLIFENIKMYQNIC